MAFSNLILKIEGRIDFYSIFEKLVYEIIEAGGLEVTLLIYKVKTQFSKFKIYFLINFFKFRIRFYQWCVKSV